MLRDCAWLTLGPVYSEILLPAIRRWSPKMVVARDYFYSILILIPLALKPKIWRKTEGLFIAFTKALNTLIHVCPLNAHSWNLLKYLGWYPFVCLYLGTIWHNPASQSEHILLDMLHLRLRCGYIFPLIMNRFVSFISLHKGE